VILVLIFLFWLKLKWNARSKLFYCIYRSSMLWWSSRTLTKIKSQSQKRFHERKYQYQLSRQTGSRNLMGPKTLPTIWGIYMKLVTKYQISAINSCWEKCDKKRTYMFNVYKNQQSRQTGNRNLMGPKTLPTHQIPTSCLPTLLSLRQRSCEGI
jgi:hypothetical protein